jgi:hypothetical protein
MTRLLLVDDAALPRVQRLAQALGPLWDVVCGSEAIAVEFGPRTTPQHAETLLLAGQLTEVTLASSAGSDAAFAARAAQAGVRVVVLPEAGQTADWAYSLYPVAEDAPDRLKPVFEHRTSHAIEEARRWLAEVPGGRAHLLIEVELPVQPLQAGDIERQFFQDADLLRSLVGDYEELIAVPIAGGAGGINSQTLTFTGAGKPTAVWSVRSGTEFSWKMIVDRPDGARTIEQMAPGVWQSAGSSVDVSQKAGVVAVWNDVLRAFDYVSAMRRSIRRRRVIDLDAESLSEKSQFKTLMSATGCGLMLLTLMGVVALLTAGALFDPRETLQRNTESAGLVVRSVDFVEGSSELRPEAQARLQPAMGQMRHNTFPVWLEPTGTAEVDQSRREELLRRMIAVGTPNPAARLEVRPLRGVWFSSVMTLAWIVLFLPLGVFLAVQFLIILTRDPKKSSAV